MTIETTYQNFRRDARIAAACGIPAVLLVALPLLAIIITWPRISLRRRILRLSAAAFALDTPLILLAIRTSHARDRSFETYLTALKAKVEHDEDICKDSVKPYLATMPRLIEMFCEDSVKKKALEDKFEKFKQS